MTPNAVALPENPQALTALQVAQAFTIATAEDLMDADAACVMLKSLEKTIKADFLEPKRKADEAHAAVCAQERKHLVPVLEARAIYKTKMDAWNTEQERIGRIAAEKFQAAERKRAEDEALARAEVAAEYGDDKGADAIISAPIAVAPAPAYQAPKTSTIFQTRWEAVIEDAALIPREYLVPDQQMLNGIARSTKGAVKIPGVRMVSRKV